MALAYDAFDIASDLSFMAASNDPTAQLQAIVSFIRIAEDNDLSAVTHPGKLYPNVVSALSERGYRVLANPEGDFTIIW